MRRRVVFLKIYCYICSILLFSVWKAHRQCGQSSAKGRFRLAKLWSLDANVYPLRSTTESWHVKTGDNPEPHRGEHKRVCDPLISNVYLSFCSTFVTSFVRLLTMGRNAQNRNTHQIRNHICGERTEFSSTSHSPLLININQLRLPYVILYGTLMMKEWAT